ncbi:peptidylprolyl isomerase [Brumimicrobium glaciale]|uniref:peptidylprolyl isomerase n=1 Tax=Brumimicrobium glaciale TaxID=200475 RepID=A0A4Q4KR92_9FLAO|nr:peptidylprolyl isomerase [Brumimicrobium glaciale]RYM35565.1 peptidylprolyl isomerase [Brumimicrobium glaciale]
MRLLFTIVFALSFTFLSIAQSKELKLEKGLYANISTNKGAIFLKLHHEEAPLTVANFVGLAEGKLKVFDSIKIKEPYYDGVVFHRVINNFMIQGGDPTGTGNGGPGYRFWDEADNGVEHMKGSLSMANAGPNTNGSQFFITHLATPHLNGKHTVFGQVLAGQDVVDLIVQGDTIKSIEIVKKGLKYKWFYNPSKVFKAEYEAKEAIVEVERLKAEKLKAQNKVRMIEAKAKSEEEYKTYFYDLVKEMEPNAIQTESGLVYVMHKEGEGELAERGDDVSLHYLGEAVFGEKFDSSYDRNAPLDFKYLEMGLIPGFNEGVGLSKQGTKIDLYIPYFLGYGKNGRQPTIQPYADLIFRIEMLKLKKN